MNYRRHLILSKSTINQALIQLDKLSVDAILFIVDYKDKLIGALTDGDVRRGLINGRSINQPIETIIQTHPRFIRRGETDITKLIEYREGDFRIIPVLDENDHIVNIINFRLVKSYLPVDAVIMAGGRGQRLSPLTDNTPKPMLKIGDTPIIEHNINRLSYFGINEFWISVNYLGEQIEEHFGNGDGRDIKIAYVKEDIPLGTIGSVSRIEEFRHDYVLVSNADILTNLDYEHFFLEFIGKEADFAVVAIPYQVKVPYAVLETNEGNISSFKEKPTYTYYSNGGIYLMKKDVLRFLPKDTFYNTTELIESLIAKNKKVIAYSLEGYWLDIGNPKDFEKAKKDITRIKF
mgnify:CR=1 FL=1